ERVRVEHLERDGGGQRRLARAAACFGGGERDRRAQALAGTGCGVMHRFGELARIVRRRTEPAIELAIDDRAHLVEECCELGWCAVRCECCCHGHPGSSLENGTVSIPPAALTRISTRCSAEAKICWPLRASCTPSS